jgi:prepilin-type N-terminal cleavage/methylation domain-containing protein
MKPIVQTHRRFGGFTLLEMLVVLGLLTIVMGVAGSITRWAILNMAESQAAASAASRMDNAIEALRRDVWQVSAIATATSRALVLKDADGRTINWQFGPLDSVRRSETSSEDQIWNGVAAGISCAADGSAVVITIPDAAHFGGGKICLMSQEMLRLQEQP